MAVFHFELYSVDELRRVQPQLIQRCTKPLIKGVVDVLQHQRILNDAEVESINEGNDLRADKCRLLIDTVIKKGDYSCNVLLREIKRQDPTLSEYLGITVADPISNMDLK
ncbi:caspase-1-B-like isoform X1 [Eleutherodactylus coqui]|uniref:caspase-1-B-like isoform X1 n=1 Tax=Eleutherodactylus coqui TaxID=57060 RepID=UPI0034633416